MTKLTSSHANRQSQERKLLQAHKWGWAIGATSTQMCGGARGEPIMLLKSTSAYRNLERTWIHQQNTY